MRAVLLALCVAACGTAGTETPGAASPTGSSKATDFTSRDLDGKTVRLSDYLGKQVILIDFWSTWCEPCKAELPHLNRLYEARRAQGFVILGVAMDGPETTAEVPAAAKRNSVTFPVLFDDDSHIAAIYNPKKSAPLSVLIDKTGRIVRVRDGYNPGDEELVAKDVANLLDGAGVTK